MYNRSGESGLTLIEIVVALAILTLILVPFTLLLTSSYVNIFAAGYKNQALYTLQTELENEVSNPSGQGETHTLEIVFPGVMQPIRITGNIVTIDESYHRGDNEETAMLKVFVP